MGALDVWEWLPPLLVLLGEVAKALARTLLDALAVEVTRKVLEELSEKGDDPP